MKNLKQCILIGILPIVLIAFFICCSENSRFNGTWGDENDLEFGTIIEFSGKSFKLTEYPRKITGSWWPVAWYGDNWENSLSFLNRSVYDIEENKLKFISTFEYKQSEDIYITNIYSNVFEGTYSISDDNKIELLFSDNSIEVFSFTNTENTITINGIMFVKR